MTPLPPRQFSIQNDITAKLRQFMSPEAIEILARATAHIMARDPSQFANLAHLFKHALDREYTYITSRHRDERRGVS
jgi:hypothetical protein